MPGDWARPVVHWEIVARDAGRQAAFCRGLFTWAIGEGPIMQVPPGPGGPEPGPGGHIRQGDRPGVVLCPAACACPSPRRHRRRAWSNGTREKR